MRHPVKWRRYPQGALAVAVACEGCKTQTFDPFSGGWRFREVWGGRRKIRCPRCLPARADVGYIAARRAGARRRRESESHDFTGLSPPRARGARAGAT
jgi:hypothetical protein